MHILLLGDRCLTAFVLMIFVGPELQLPAYFSPIFFPMGNAATGFFVVFALIAGVVGAASEITGFNHIRYWNYDSLPSALSSALVAWTLTLLAMGLAHCHRLVFYFFPSLFYLAPLKKIY